MPTISYFLGIIIQMHWKDHAPPHFHALYAEHEAAYNIQELSILSGSLPKRAHAFVLEWAALHQQELMENWTLCRSNQAPRSIIPLE